MATMQLWVRDQVGHIHTIDCDSSDRVEDVKRLIQHALNTTDIVMLIFAGKMLADDRSFEDCGIEPYQGPKIACVFRNPLQIVPPAPTVTALGDGGGDGGEVAQAEQKEGQTPIANALSQHGVLNNAAKQQQQNQRLMGVAVLGLLDRIKQACRRMPGLDPQAAFSFTATVVSKCTKNQLDDMYTNPQNHAIPPALVATIRSHVDQNPILQQLSSDSDFAGRIKRQLINGEENQLRQEFGVSQNVVNDGGDAAQDGGPKQSSGSNCVVM